MSESTRIREGFFTDFAEKVQFLDTKVPIQLSGGFRSRAGMAEAVSTGTCSLIGLGRTAVLQPDLPTSVLLNPELGDDHALAESHLVRGQWLAKLIPVKGMGAELGIQVFYYNMRRMGHGLMSDPKAGIPTVVLDGILDTFRSSFNRILGGLWSSFRLHPAGEGINSG